MKRILALILFVAALSASFVLLPSTTDGGCAPVVQVPQVVATTQTITTVATIPVLIPSVSYQFLPAVAAVQNPQGVVSIQQELSELRALLNQMRTQLAANDGPPAVSTSASTATPKPPTVSGTAVASENIVRSRCASCHTGPNGKGGVSLFNENGQYAANIDWSTIWYVTKQNRMPLGADKDPSKRLTTEERKQVLETMLSQPDQ